MNNVFYPQDWSARWYLTRDSIAKECTNSNWWFENVWYFALTFLPRDMPGVSASTINPVKAFPVLALGSGLVLANTKNLQEEYYTTNIQSDRLKVYK